MKSNFNRARPKSADPRPKYSEKRKIECILNKDDIPPICDNEHLLGECYCHLCTCGKHLCPSDYKKKIISAHSHFSTQYQQTYKKFSSKPIIQKAPPEFRPVQYPLDSLTTTQKDFTKPEISKTENYSPLKSSGRSLKFVGKTNYSSNFYV